MLYKGFTPIQVFDNHIQQVRTKYLENPHVIPIRDDYLSLKDIFNISQQVAIEKYQLHINDAESTKCWAMQNPSWVFFFQEQCTRSGMPFVIGLQSPWQRQICQTYGNNNVLAMDSTFGTNQYKMALYTIMVFDSHKNGIPIAWIVSSSSKRLDIIPWLKAFRNVMLDNFKSWSPNAFLIDDAEPKM